MTAPATDSPRMTFGQIRQSFISIKSELETLQETLFADFSLATVEDRRILLRKIEYLDYKRKLLKTWCERSDLEVRSLTTTAERLMIRLQHEKSIIDLTPPHERSFFPLIGVFYHLELVINRQKDLENRLIRNRLWCLVQSKRLALTRRLGMKLRYMLSIRDHISFCTFKLNALEGMPLNETPLSTNQDFTEHLKRSANFLRKVERDREDMILDPRIDPVMRNFWLCAEQIPVWFYGNWEDNDGNQRRRYVQRAHVWHVLIRTLEPRTGLTEDLFHGDFCAEFIHWARVGGRYRGRGKKELLDALERFMKSDEWDPKTEEEEENVPSSSADQEEEGGVVVPESNATQEEDGGGVVVPGSSANQQEEAPTETPLPPSTFTPYLPRKPLIPPTRLPTMSTLTSSSSSTPGNPAFQAMIDDLSSALPLPAIPDPLRPPLSERPEDQDPRVANDPFLRHLYAPTRRYARRTHLRREARRRAEEMMARAEQGSRGEGD